MTKCILHNRWPLKSDFLSFCKNDVLLRERGLALLDVFALGPRAGLPTEVDGDAHEEATFIQEVAGDVHAHQQQEEDHDEDAHDGAGAHTWTSGRCVWRGNNEGGKRKQSRGEKLGERGGFYMRERGWRES